MACITLVLSCRLMLTRKVCKQSWCCCAKLSTPHPPPGTNSAKGCYQSDQHHNTNIRLTCSRNMFRDMFCSNLFPSRTPLPNLKVEYAFGGPSQHSNGGVYKQQPKRVPAGEAGDVNTPGAPRWSKTLLVGTVWNLCIETLPRHCCGAEERCVI